LEETRLPLTINVGGNYTQEAGGTLALGIGGTLGSQYDHVHVGGTVTLKGGTLFVSSLNNFQPQAGNAFALLQGSIDKTVPFGFSELDDLSLNGNPNLHPWVFYLRNAVLLIYAKSAQPAGPTLAAETEESEQEELRKLAPGQTPPPPPSNGGSAEVTPPPTEPVGPSTPEAEAEERMEEEHAEQFVSNQSLPQLDPNQPVPESVVIELLDPTVEQLTAAFEIGFSGANIQRFNLDDRLVQIQRGVTGFMPPPPSAPPPTGKEAVGKGEKAVAPAPQPAPTNRWGVWANGWGDFVDVQDTAPLVRGYRFTTGGMSAGIDYRIFDNLAVGLFGGYSHLDRSQTRKC
jgi:hypothetical protein